jgi:hypothetical protein
MDLLLARLLDAEHVPMELHFALHDIAGHLEVVDAQVGCRLLWMQKSPGISNVGIS